MLWVDDDASINRMAVRVLPRRGIDVEVAVDASSAFHAATRGPHAAIVLDQRLPGCADLEVLRQLRSAGDQTPVVMITGHGSLEAAVDALTLGVVDYLVKPAHTERILAAIHVAIRAGTCPSLNRAPAMVLHPDVSLALLAVLFNASWACEVQLQTQLAWAVADDLSFAERVAVVEALGHVVESASEEEMRRQVVTCLWRGLSRVGAMPSPEVQAFVKLITSEAARTWHLKSEVVAKESGTSMPKLSQLVHDELGASPDRCRLIGHLMPGLRELAHSTEHVGQIAYRLDYSLLSAFDNRFKELWNVAPTGFRRILAGLA